MFSNPFYRYDRVFVFTEHLLKIQLTRVERFHSHLEPMRLIKKDLFSEQVIYYAITNQ